jgi:uncharacterized protein
MKPTVVLMLKEPAPGTVKTRLARSIGPEAACRIYRLLVEKQLLEIPDHWDVEICFAPATSVQVMQQWLGSAYRYEAQVEGDLGERMAAAIVRNVVADSKAVIMLGGDCPYVDTKLLLKTEKRLFEQDVVVGPALDGGYYLIGLKQEWPKLFKGIAWSTEVVLEQTIGIIKDLNLRYDLLELLEDVDDLPSWERAEKKFNFQF